MILAILCLTAGIAGGWFLRASQSPASTASANAAPASAAGPASAMPSPSRSNQMADAQAAPLIDKLKANPGNPDLLASIGNVYYDA